jgi:cell division protein FtsB
MLKNAIWLFALCVIVLFIFLPSYTQYQDKRQKVDEYDRQIIRLQRQNAKLAKEKKLLESDPAYLEKVAREKMGLVREGETIYRLTPEETQAVNKKK